MNERAAEVVDGRFDRAFEFLCECAYLNCSIFLTVRLEDYERVRANGRRFFVAHGHQLPRFETVVEQGPEWLVVEKIGVAGQTAAEEDPRSTES